MENIKEEIVKDLEKVNNLNELSALLDISTNVTFEFGNSFFNVI